MPNEPEIWAKTDKYVMLPSYLNYRLTGELKDSVANMIGHVPFDYKNLSLIHIYEWKLTLLDNSSNFAVTEKTADAAPDDTVTLNYTCLLYTSRCV